MKINSIDKLQNKIDKSYAKKKKECDSILSKLRSPTLTPEEIELCYKSGVVLLYAHWESLVKQIAKYYLDYLCSHGKKFSELKPHFLYFTLAKLLNDSSTINLNNYSVFEKTQDFFTNPLSEAFTNVPSNSISTRENQNMSFEEFEFIIKKIGLTNRDSYALRKNLINHILLVQRNKIAHEGVSTENSATMKETFNTLNSKIWEILDQVKQDVLYAAENKTYLKPIVSL